MRYLIPAGLLAVAMLMSSCDPPRRVASKPDAAKIDRDKAADPIPPNEKAMIAKPVEPPRPASVIVRDKDGKNVTIELGPDVVVMMMATWCPHSGPVRDLMKKHKNADGLAGLRIVYVFEDEWPRVRDMLAKEAGTPREQIEKQLAESRAAKGGGPLLAPEFLQACDAEIFYVHPDHPLPGEGFPRDVARDGQIRPGNAGQWLQNRLGQ